MQQRALLRVAHFTAGIDGRHEESLQCMPACTLHDRRYDTVCSSRKLCSPQRIVVLDSIVKCEAELEGKSVASVYAQHAFKGWP